jgi:putative transposase
LPDPKPRSEDQAVGLDLELGHFCVLSDGTLVENPRHFERYRRKLRRAGRSLNRKEKGSNGWKKQARRLPRLYHTLQNVRRDYLHQISTQIARRYPTVYVEALNIQGMVKNPRHSRSIQDCGWGMFVRMLSYKTQVVKVNAMHTSQTCHRCGAVDPDSRVSQSLFICRSCGHTEHADINAAQNIFSRGAAVVRQREAMACA